MIEFHRTAVSIHEDTFSVLNSRSKDFKRNLSYVVDCALTRYFALIEQAQKTCASKFTEEEITSFGMGLRMHFTNLRNLKITQLRMMVRGLQEEKVITHECAEKILSLPPDEFLAILEIAEKRMVRNR